VEPLNHIRRFLRQLHELLQRDWKEGAAQLWIRGTDWLD